MITPEVQDPLYAYMGGIVRKYGGRLLEIGGMPDHVHLLVELSLLDRYTAMLRDVKASSTKWVRSEFPHQRGFAWQEGFGSLTVSYSQIERVRTYIQNQEEHHKRVSFEDEFTSLLKKHNISYDPRFVLG